MPRFLAFLLFLPAVLMAGCSTDASLAYTPRGGIIAAAPVIATVEATDQRKESSNRLATIMGGFGNPLKILNTVRPVKDEVASVFAQGLGARGLLRSDGAGPFRIALLIRKFDADQLMGSKARIDIDMTVIDQASNRPIYSDTVADERGNFVFFGNGIFANIEDLQKLAQTLLDATVDRMLDKPEFRAAIGRLPAY